MRVAFVAGFLACSAPPAKPPAGPPVGVPARQRDLAVAEPVPRPPEPQPAQLDPYDPRLNVAGVERGARREEVILRRHPMREPRDVLVAESDLWSPCVQEFVRAQPAHVRRALTTAFSRYTVTCDAEKRVIVTPSHDVRGRPYIAYAGTFAPGRHELVVQFAACGAADPIDEIAIVYDRKRWSSYLLSTERVGTCTIASIDDQRAVRRMLRDVIDARDAVVVFEGAGVADLPLTDEMRRDLRVMLDVLDALAT